MADPTATIEFILRVEGYTKATKQFLLEHQEIGGVPGMSIFPGGAPPLHSITKRELVPFLLRHATVKVMQAFEHYEPDEVLHFEMGLVNQATHDYEVPDLTLEEAVKLLEKTWGSEEVEDSEDGE